MRKAVALFGGTFDPVHRGHLEMARLAREKQALDRVVFVPCFRSPFKSQSTQASGPQRAEMLRLSIADEGWADWAEVSEIEIGRQGPSYSWETVAAMERHWPGARLRWILGGDQWREIHRWARADYLAAHLEFIVFARDGDVPEPREGWVEHLIPFDRPESATAIREGRAGGDWLTPQAAAYAAGEGLYPLHFRKK